MLSTTPRGPSNRAQTIVLWAFAGYLWIWAIWEVVASARR